MEVYTNWIFMDVFACAETINWGLWASHHGRLKKFIYYLIDKGNICDIIITSDYTENVEE